MRREYSEKTQKGREKRYAAEMRAKIARHTGPLSEKLLRPTDKKHIPEDGKANTSMSDYVWLPIRFEGDKPVIDWQDEWRIEDYE